MRPIAILLTSMLTACAGATPTIRPVEPLQAQRSPDDFACPGWPVGRLLAAAGIPDPAGRAREMLAIIAEDGEAAARTCRCRLAIIGAREAELGRVSGRVTVPPMCQLEQAPAT